jgi:hypothetical protein
MPILLNFLFLCRRRRRGFLFIFNTRKKPIKCFPSVITHTHTWHHCHGYPRESRKIIPQVYFTRQIYCSCCRSRIQRRSGSFWHFMNSHSLKTTTAVCRLDLVQWNKTRYSYDVMWGWWSWWCLTQYTPQRAVSEEISKRINIVLMMELRNRGEASCCVLIGWSPERA